MKTIVLRWLRISSRIARVDRRPDARAQVRADRRAAGLLLVRQDLAERGHVLDRDDDLELERLARAGVDDRRPRGRARRRRGTGRSPRAAAAWRSGRSAAAALRRRRRPRRCSRRSRREREVRAALRAGDRVDLVDDHVLDAAQDLAGLAGEQQVELLGRRDEDVRRAAGDLAAVLGRRVAGAAGDGDLAARSSPSRCAGEADAGQRRPQVALDVVGQGLERGDVEDADVAGLLARGLRARVAGEPVEASRGMRRGSCRSRSGRGSACARPRRWPPSPRPAPGSAPRSSPRTRPGRRARRARADRRRRSVATGPSSIGGGAFRPLVRFCCRVLHWVGGTQARVIAGSDRFRTQSVSIRPLRSG